MVTKVSDIKEVVRRGRSDPKSAFAELKQLAAASNWQTREVAATALVEIGKTDQDAVVREALRWAKDRDPNVRRAASEGLRGIVKVDPDAVRPVLELLRGDSELYVKKSVANVLRNASAKHADFVLHLCGQWVRSYNRDTQWIVKEGLRKLRATRAREVEKILRSLGIPA